MKGGRNMGVFAARGLGKTYRGKLVNRKDGRISLDWERPGFTALDGVDLTMEAGHIYGLVGNNGAGKTTLMRIIAGLTRPSTGTFTLFGAETEKELFAARQRMGSLIARPTGYDHLTLRQNLVSQAMLIPEERREEAAAICALVGLEEGPQSRRLWMASTGEKQRYGLASALLGSPELLLLDEPMNGLDPRGIVDTRELLLRLNRERGMTILISSHLLAELHQVATDYIFLHRGRVLETLTAEELDRRIEERGLNSVEAYFLALTEEAGEVSR